jgi:uncharacterized Zn finger protein
MTPADERPWNLWDETPPPRRVANGLVAAARIERPTGGLGSSLVRRVLDRASPGIANRGRGYARAGQTISVEIDRGRIAGEIQGSDALPYQAEITCTVPEVDRRRFVLALQHALPEPVTEIPSSYTRDLRTELAENRILLDAALTVRCNCSYRGVCKHLVALAYVAGEQLDDSPARIAAVLGVTDEDLQVEADVEPEVAEEPETAVFDRRREAQLARSIAALDRRDPLDRDAVLARAAEILHPPPAVANALDLDLYLDPIEP